jgi:signal transduction histidine kinase
VQLAKPIEIFIDQANAISHEIKQADKSIKELAGQTALYRGLATIGISSAVFGHEIQGTIDKFKSATTAAALTLDIPKPDLSVVKHEIEKALKYSDHVAAWGKFALDRIQDGKRTKAEQDIGMICRGVIKDIKPVFSAEHIEIDPEGLDFPKIKARILEMDIEAVLLNYMTNAYHACRQENRPRKISVALKKSKNDTTDGWELIVSDSGPGVASQYINKVWDPLFTTKVDKSGKQVGTGLGLAIVKSIADENHGRVSVDQDPTLLGAKFSFWSPF